MFQIHNFFMWLTITFYITSFGLTQIIEINSTLVFGVLVCLTTFDLVIKMVGVILYINFVKQMFFYELASYS